MHAPGLGPELSEFVLQGVYLGVAAFVSFTNLCVLSGKELTYVLGFPPSPLYCEDIKLGSKDCHFALSKVNC